MLENLNVEEIVFIDIETIPAASSFNTLTPEWQQHWQHKMRFQVREGEDPGSIYERAGIYAEFGRIICISTGYLFKKKNEYHFRVKSFSDDEERLLLSNFFNALALFEKAGKKKLCAHNGQEFDYPYISRRSLVNGLDLPGIFDIAGSKPWEVKDQLLDTLQLWKFGDYKHYTALALLCSLFNIPTPKDEMDGSQVARVYYEENNLEKITRYCEKDALAVANLLLCYKKMPIIPMENMEVA